MSFKDRFAEPSSWAAICVAIVAGIIATTVALPSLAQTALLIVAAVAVALGFGLPERLRDRK